MTWSETALESGETGELPVNAVGFSSVASEHSAKSFSSWITPPMLYSYLPNLPKSA